MADRLTQLQDCLDDLATQMFASLRYIQTHHAYAPIEGQPDMNPSSETSANPSANPSSDGGALTNGTSTGNPAQAGAAGQSNGTSESKAEELVPDTPEAFQAALRELARDLVIKEQQIEYLISVLPGLGSSESNQNQRIQALEKELREADDQRKAAMQDREEMLRQLGQLAAQCKRVY
ncbi:hypothetical protein MBLNU459_g7972t1 [Dothideomycetes sp. NU459]